MTQLDGKDGPREGWVAIVDKQVNRSITTTARVVHDQVQVPVDVRDGRDHALRVVPPRLREHRPLAEAFVAVVFEPQQRITSRRRGRDDIQVAVLIQINRDGVCGGVQIVTYDMFDEAET